MLSAGIALFIAHPVWPKSPANMTILAVLALSWHSNEAKQLKKEQ